MNPLLAEWTGPHQTPDFSTVREEDFAAAIAEAMEAARTETLAIADQKAAPTFENTILPWERSGKALNRVLGLFYTLAGSDSTPGIEALQREFSPKLAAFSSELSMHPGLFARVSAVFEGRDALGKEERRVVEEYHRRMVRSGAALDEAGRIRLKEISQELSTLATSFTQNVLADEREWFMPLSPADLEGLPEDIVAAAASAAEERGQKGHVVTLSRSLIAPFFTYSPRRDLREKAFAAWVARGENGGATDNTGIVKRTLELRQERAKLLGFASFADFKLKPEMAKTPEAVRGLLMAAWEPAKAAANRDAARLAEMMHGDGINGDLRPWDWRYYAEKLRQAEYDFDEAALKPYLEIGRVRDAAFDTAARLFGLSFRPLDLKLNHPDARAWEVLSGERHMGVFVADYFNRSSKRSGAWCSSIRDQSRIDGEQRPIVYNVCNFAKAPAGEPTLLSLDDARTLFHEFGHALHNLLSDVTYETIAGTSVARDWVELPSQLYEHWLTTDEVLSAHARHVKTGEPMPDALREKLKAAATFDQGFATVEYTASALVDLAFHEGEPPSDPMAMQAEVLAGLGMPEAIVMRHATPHFQHVFAGDGYSAGYYSYMWSEVLDADAFASFEETGDPFDAGRAELLHRYIYSSGASEEPEELYLAFRGKMPSVEAMLKKRGLIAA